MILRSDLPNTGFFNSLKGHKFAEFPTRERFADTRAEIIERARRL